MRLNGALKPRQGAPTYGRSTGAKKYRDKQQERRCNNNNKINKRQRPCDWRMTALLLRNNNNNNKKSPIIIINNNSSSAQKEEENKMRNNIIQQIQQRNDKVTTVKISSNNIYNSTKINVKFCCRNNKEPATTQRQHQTQQQQQENIEFDYGICRAQRNAAEAVASDSSNNDNIVAISTTTTTTKMFLNVIGISSYELNSNNNERCFHRLTSSVQLLLLPLITLLPPVLVATLICCCVQFFKRLSVTAVKMVRVQQSLMRTTKKSNRIPEIQATAGDGGHGGRGLAFGVLCVFSALALLPHPVACDDGDFFGVNSFSMGPETTTPEFGYHFAFDYASRGQKKFGDKCENTLECGFPGSICDPKKKSCQCTEDLPVTNHIDKCGKEAAVNESCFFNEQCEVKYFQTECRDGRCVCRFEMSPIWGKDGSVECKGRQDKRGPETYIDPAMIGVLVGMALMFIIICVVLRLFSQARWRENRTIFNTPNPRLMNVSLLRDSKLLHGQERRGSRMSVRAPSRQPSMASLRPHSPNPSLGKTGRSMTRSKSNTRSSDSRVSDASNCSRLLEHHPITTAMQHSTHPHTHSHPHTHAHNALPSTSAANINNINHATTTTYIATSPGAGSACGTPSPPAAAAAPTVAIKANKF